MILVSIIVPVYNTEKYLEKCIKSIQSQKIDKNQYEILLINDGSTNQEVDRNCKAYSELDECIKYIYQENSGVSSARNTGINNSKGKYIIFSFPGR